MYFQLPKCLSLVRLQYRKGLWNDPKPKIIQLISYTLFGGKNYDPSLMTIVNYVTHPCIGRILFFLEHCDSFFTILVYGCLGYLTYAISLFLLSVSCPEAWNKTLYPQAL